MQVIEGIPGMRNVMYKQISVETWDQDGQWGVNAGAAFSVVLATNLGQR